MEFNRKLTKEEKDRYITISELTWGGSPLDVDWAIGTNIYKEMEAKLFPPDDDKLICKRCGHENTEGFIKYFDYCERCGLNLKQNQI